jgi:subtilisin-like proprotein convertase family protein
MLHQRVRLLAIPGALAFGWIAAGVAGAASAPSPAATPKAKVQLFRAVKSGVSPAVRDLAPVRRAADPLREYEVPNPPDKRWEDLSNLIRRDVASPDGALQSFYAPDAMPAPIANFQGVSQATQGAVSGFFVSPPDTVGDVGPNHYVQCVNLACQIFSKAVPNPSLSAVFTISSLFASLGGECLNTNDGDPIVLYDEQADRWQLSQFSVTNRPPSHECVAVSQTGDPTGAWYLYDFVIPDNYFNDYPKLGVWPDGYYMTAPLFEGPVFGQGVFVMNRAKMLVGDPTAELVFFDLTLAYPGLGRVLPADVDGHSPPQGTPNYVIGTAADEFGDPADAIRIFEVKADFNDVDNSTFTELPSVATAAYDPTFTEVSGNCGFAFTSRDDVEQPPPANCGQRVDTLSGRPMNRLAYRNFGTYESLIFSHTVDVNATPPSAVSGHRAGARYTELRRTLPGGAWAVNEEATFSPDAVHRFMPSAAMDGQGNIAVGYTASDATTVFPAVRWAGRLATDPPNGLFQGEGIVAAGGRSQTSTGSRWGDYSAMSVDPADDCTFWFTQEYYDPVAPVPCSATTCWTTRIASFKFPGCSVTRPTGALTGTVTDACTGLPLAGVLVDVNGYTAVTNGSGNYTINMPPGTYNAVASKVGYASGTAAGVAVPGAQNFALACGNINGTVTDCTTLAAISGAKVKVSPVGTAVFTPVAGTYSIALPNGSYSVTGSAPGYFSKTTTGVVVNNGPTANSFCLNAAPALAVTASAIDDTPGNSNSAVDYAECFRLNLTLTNTGSVAANGITATLKTTSSGVIVSDAASTYPNIAGSGGTGTNATPFKLVSNPNPAAAGAPIDLVLTLTTTGGSVDVPFTLTTGGAGTATTAAATGPVAIPDNNGFGASINIPVSGFTGTLSKVRFRTRITHTFDGDLILRLKAPDGTIGLLAYQVGGAGAGFGTDCPADANDTTFDDGAATSILDGTAPYVGSFRPQQPLSVFGGKSAASVNGTWQFQVVDLGPADIGNIECVTLELNGTAFGGGGCYTKGDMNHANRQTDLIFNRLATPLGAPTNVNAVWFMDGVTATAAVPSNISPNAASADWQIFGADDFNHDDKTDLMFRNTTTGAVEFWLMDGNTSPPARVGAAVPLTGGPTLALNWQVAATGDMNRDGRPDILWRNTTSQKLVGWLMGQSGAPGTQKTGNLIPTPDQAINSNWRVVALLDINLDGNVDLLWYNSTSGNIVYWLMDGNFVRITGLFTNPTNAGNNNWKVVAAGDYGTTCTNPARDNQFDIVWRNDNSAFIVVWTMDSSGNRTSGCFTIPNGPTFADAPDAPPDWFVVGPR